MSEKTIERGKKKTADLSDLFKLLLLSTLLLIRGLEDVSRIPAARFLPALQMD